MIEPVSDDFTMLTRPAWRANDEMMISGALPSVALSRPPTVGPRKRARASVASPINPASGTIASADARNTRIGLAPNRSRPIPIGTKTSSQFRLIGIAPAPAWSVPRRAGTQYPAVRRPDQGCVGANRCPPSDHRRVGIQSQQ